MKTSDYMGQAKMLCEDVINRMYPEDMDPYNVVPAHMTLKRVMEAFDVEIELPDFEEVEEYAAATAASLLTKPSVQSETDNSPSSDMVEGLRKANRGLQEYVKNLTSKLKNPNTTAVPNIGTRKDV